MVNGLQNLATSLILVSCSDNTVTPEPSPFTIPTSGSTYTYLEYATDKLGNKVPDTEVTDVESVIASNISYSGKNGVWAISSTENNDTTYFCVDQNNDVLFKPSGGADIFGDDTWLRIPVTTGTAFSDSTASTQDFNGIPVELRTTMNITRIADEQVTVGSQSFKTTKVRLNINVKALAFGQVVNESNLESTLWYAPSLGHFLRMVQPATTLGGQDENGSYRSLQSYNLK